jgi:hypothetical protein
MLESWCKNKTPENVATWIANPENITIVAQQINKQILDGHPRIC